jgi:Ca2+-binding EF-hand superfamily protein
LKIFNKYDKDKSGYLEKIEVINMLNEILLNQGRQKTTISQFNRFFAEFDDNGDGVISRGECYNFVKRFLGGPVVTKLDPIEQLVLKIFSKYDKDRSGYLDKPEVLKMLDEILINQGRP